MEFRHIPIMLSQVLDNLDIKSDGIYVDATIGGAGHSLEIAKRLNKDGILIGFDKDTEAIEVCKKRLVDVDCKVILVNSDYKNLRQVLSENGIEKVDGILADLGVSSYQIDNAERGFSYSKDATLDMRMDSSQSLDAKYIVNNYKESELIRILYDFGEENFARSIVKNIVEERKKQQILTTGQLVKIIEKSVPKKVLHKGGSVAKKTFQALRIEVNGELDSLKGFLDDAIDCLKKDGRICIITFHSLEDRIVKNVFKKEASDCLCPSDFPICVCKHKKSIEIISKKPIVPTKEEMEKNSRCSSSKLRVAKKI